MEKYLQDINRKFSEIEPFTKFKKMGLGLFVFLLVTGMVFDLIGMIPLMNLVTNFLFLFFVKINLFLVGYRGGMTWKVVLAAATWAIDVIIPLWLTCTSFVIGFHWINNHYFYRQEEKRMRRNEQDLASPGDASPQAPW